MTKRILYIPNERGDWRQTGFRHALSRLREAELISEVRVFSYLWRLHEGQCEVYHALLLLIDDFRPDIVLIQHPAGMGLLNGHWEKLRRQHDFVLLLHEGDIYDRLRKRMPIDLCNTARNSDVTFTVGASRQMGYFRRAGARDIRWVPSSFSSDDFGHLERNRKKLYDVVMIANESSSGIPLMSMPGSRDRKRLVHELERNFGSRFAIYGRGWEGSSAKGPLPFVEQENVIQKSWITANWDHYPSEARSFSDRLPIALASGTIHATSSHPGYEGIFGVQDKFIRHRNSVSQLVQSIRQLLEESSEGERIELAEQSRRFAHDHFRQDDLIVRMLNTGGAAIGSSSARRAKAIAVPMLTEL